MRAAFIQTLVELAGQDSRIVLLTADLGFMALEPFMEGFPERFYNVGVAEQNMVGVATGLAEAGFIPYIYSIVTFASLRPFEFIRNGPILHQFPVRIVAVGGGVEYAAAGPTHHGLEDVGVMRTQPGIGIAVPADPRQARTALLATWDAPGPFYYRLGKDDNAQVSGLDGRFRVGRVEVIEHGQDVLILAMGPVAREATVAATRLRGHGIRCTVGVVASINPAPTGDLIEMLAEYPAVVTVEAHNVTGGLGALVCEVAAEHGARSRIIRCGMRSTTDGATGSQDFYYRAHGLSADALVQVVLNIPSIRTALPNTTQDLPSGAFIHGDTTRE
ncbi:MAG TPA: transketolase C-terminal domain-containing protein [Ktedonobacterales bacterium]|nr:transketolase C-terminal domain-containing protein [Ktedonobacterales bacterium]